MINNLKTFFRNGTPFIWLSGAFLSIALMMILGLVLFIAKEGLQTFWPAPIAQFQLIDGSKVSGIITKYDAATTQDTAKYQLRIGNRDLNGLDFKWVEESSILSTVYPKDIVLAEREEFGYFIGRFDFLLTRELQTPLANNRIPESVIKENQELKDRILKIRKTEIGNINEKVEQNRLALKTSLNEETRERVLRENLSLEEDYKILAEQLVALEATINESSLQARVDDGRIITLKTKSIVRYFEPNNLTFFDKSKIFLSRINEFILGQPRESNTEGGVFPAIFGTVLMVLIMSIMVVPLGVIAAIYLKEYAGNNLLTRSIRIAVNNLAGVPSIVFGVFGLGFFIYGVGGFIDQSLFKQALPAPTYGTGGILWASLTLALLTIPVVIVATEESIAAIPRSQREASLALGSTKWQTITNIVLPGSAPGTLTGFILAMARGAGEVAPLVITGVVKLAPSLPIDSTWPFFHLDRKFMHLGFHIFDVGFQSPNSEAAKPMVFMTALLLVLIVVTLNLAALILRKRLRKNLGGSTF